MKFLTVCGCLCLLPFVAGCTVVGSAHPLFTGKEPAEDLPIAGVWEPDPPDPDVPGTVTVTNRGNGEYEVSIPSNNSDDPGKNQSYEYDATIRRVENHLFFDATFQELKMRDGEMTKDDLPVFPMHFVGVIRLEGDAAILRWLDDDWLQRALDEKRLRLPHVAQPGYILLLAPAPEMQSFILSHVEDQEAFPAIKYHRQKRTGG